MENCTANPSEFCVSAKCIGICGFKFHALLIEMLGTRPARKIRQHGRHRNKKPCHLLGIAPHWVSLSTYQARDGRDKLPSHPLKACCGLAPPQYPRRGLSTPKTGSLASAWPPPELSPAHRRGQILIARYIPQPSMRPHLPLSRRRFASLKYVAVPFRVLPSDTRASRTSSAW